MQAPRTPKCFGEQDEYDISVALTLRAVPFSAVVRWHSIYQEPVGVNSMRHARNAIIETADPGFVPTTLPPTNTEELGTTIEEVIEVGLQISRLEDIELASALQTHYDRVMPQLGSLAAEHGLELPFGSK